MYTLATIKCGAAKLPITCFGIPLGANPKKSGTWDLMLDNVLKRFAMCKMKTFFGAGRLIFIKAVLNNLRCNV